MSKKGTFTLKTPKVPITLSMDKGIVKMFCPHCKQLLFWGKGSPHFRSERMIEKHVTRCTEQKELAETLVECQETIA